MCGIAGLATPPGTFPSEVLKSRVTTMSMALLHRGPDSGDAWVHESSPVAFGHRRLAIIDLSADGAQPMHRGPLTISFNGEIYNFEALRAELEADGTRFRSRSDTEVLLACVEKWGLEHALTRLVGMFAFALWDDRDKSLWLGRDRFGEKPLYYWRSQGGVAFASELKALRTLPEFTPDLDLHSVDAFLRRNCVPGPGTIYQGVAQVPPGTAVGFRVEHTVASLRAITYWSVDRTIDEARAQPFTGSFAEATSELERLLTASVRGQAISDVPLGAFLSGGIDSSTITALLQSVSSQPVRTFTIGSHSSSNEADEAAAVARHLGTDHTVLMISAQDALDVVPLLPQMFDEPFGDSSQIPTFLVAQMARRHVTVALSGDAGDEVFGGYNRHVMAATTWPKLTRVPAPVRQLLGRAALGVRPGWWDAIERPLQRTGRWKLKGGLGNRVHKSARLLGANSASSLYEGLTTHWSADVQLLRDVAPSRVTAPDITTLTMAENMMRLDTQRYLVDDILTKVDRAAMASSLETRVPFLDPAVFTFAWTLPLGYRIGAGGGKLVVRELLAKHVPRELFERPKTGFGVPLGEWLRGPLRPWAEELLTPSSLDTSGLMAKPILGAWQDHRSGRRNNEHALWNALMFLAWRQQHR